MTLVPRVSVLLVQVTLLFIMRKKETGDKWELWFDASNDGISGASGGPFVFVVEKQNFYGYFGSDVGWDLVGRGITGNTGNTGADAVFGRSYTQQSRC